jgi:hypothetical protein
MSTLKIVEGITFVAGHEVSVDGKEFIRCRVHGCILAYAGGEYRFTECEVRPGGLAFSGAASATLAFASQHGATGIKKLITAAGVALTDAAAPTTVLTELHGRRFEANDTVWVDGTRFVDCVFNGCTFGYRGVSSWEMIRCLGKPGAVVLEGSARDTVRLLKRNGYIDLTEFSTDDPSKDN